MRNFLWLGLVGSIILLGGCAAHHTSDIEQNEQIDLYLSTLDDKHFVWCELDMEQCRKDFDKWKGTAQGRMIMEESKQEAIGQTYNTHHLPNVFRNPVYE